MSLRAEDLPRCPTCHARPYIETLSLSEHDKRYSIVHLNKYGDCSVWTSKFYTLESAVASWKQIAEEASHEQRRTT